MAFLLAAAVFYGVFVLVRSGAHQRWPLVLGRIALEEIPDRAARHYGDRPLFTTDEACGWTVPSIQHLYPDATAWSAERIRATAAHVAAALAGLGVQPADRVAVMKRNHLDMHVFAAAIVRTGAIACPVNNTLETGLLNDYFNNVGTRVLISDAETLRRILADGAALGTISTIILADRRTRDAESIRSALARAPHSGIALHWIEEALARTGSELAAVPRNGVGIFYVVHSSGTMGTPKAIALRNRAQSHAVRGWLSYVHLSRTRDRGYLAVPNHHQAALLTFNSTLLLGLPAHWTAAYARAGFDPKHVIRELADGQFTAYFGFPITYTQLKEVDLSKFDLRPMKLWASTADTSHETIMRQFAAVGGAFRSVGIPLDGAVFLDAQGSSEVGTPSTIRYVTRFTTQFGCRIGRPGSTPFGPVVRVATPEGDEAPRCVVGRLEVRGRTLFAGYWKNAELTRAAMRHGWFVTGDVACIARDGNVIQLDREADVIQTRRGAVFSLPIEDIVHHHPAIYDVCVYGARQRDGTQLAAAAIAIRAGYIITAETLRRELNTMLPPKQRLAEVTIVPWNEFPIGVTGKTLKRVFRERSEKLALIRPTPVASRA
jgi:long-chain acyl-CoA synthetase